VKNLPSKTQTALLAATLLAAGGWVQAAFEWPRYEVILHRSPFGRMPTGPTESTPPVEVPALAAQYRLCTLYLGLDGHMRAGVVQKNNHLSLILRLNEPINGLELLSLDYVGGTARFRRDQQEFSLKLDAAGAAPPITTPAATPPMPGNPASGRSSYAERRERLLERIREAREQRTQPSNEALEQELQQQQMEVLRRGQPPLPVPITLEMDRQLVAEGVLPPLNN